MTTSDITLQIDQLHAQLLAEREARAELERELHLLHAFIRRAGHDLKTPITTLKTSLYLVQRKPEMATSERLSMMEGQLDRLSHLVAAMGLMARLEDMTHLDLEEHDIRTAIHEALWTVEAQAQTNEIKVQTHIVDDLPLLALHFEEIKRALVNLLDNAIRYSEVGGTVVVNVFEMHGHICIDVIDNGVGFSQDEMDHLFERFYRGVHGIDTHERGAGMGLPITRRIVELHRGKMRVTAEVGVGSTFRVMLPIS